MGGLENTELNEAEIGKQSSKKSKKAKGRHNKKRFLLFDPSSKSDLVSLCDDGLTLLNLESGNNNESDNAESNSVSLNFDRDSSDDEDVENLPNDNVPVVADDSSSPKEKLAGLFCGSCNIKFSDLTEQRFHYTLDWHRYNVKMKLHGQGAVTEAKFSEMLGMCAIQNNILYIYMSRKNFFNQHLFLFLNR